MVWDNADDACDGEDEEIRGDLMEVAEEGEESSIVDEAAAEGDAPLLQTASPASLTPALLIVRSLSYRIPISVYTHASQSCIKILFAASIRVNPPSFKWVENETLTDFLDFSARRRIKTARKG